MAGCEESRMAVSKPDHRPVRVECGVCGARCAVRGARARGEDSHGNRLIGWANVHPRFHSPTAPFSSTISLSVVMMPGPSS